MAFELRPSCGRVPLSFSRLQTSWQPLHSKMAARRICEPISANSQTLHLLWVDQHCFKNRKLYVYEALNAAAQSVGMHLLAVKNAAKYELWMDLCCTTAHILVMTWQEARACICSLQRRPHVRTPLRMFVYAEGRQNFFTCMLVEKFFGFWRSCGNC